MFAPPVAKVKSTGLSRSTVAPERASLSAVDPANRQGSVGHQDSLHLMRRRADPNAAAGQREADAAAIAGQGAGRSWRWSGISVFPPGTPSLFEAPRLPIQAKLRVGAVDDPLEHEADRVADEVMRTPDPTLYVTAAPLQIRCKCAACEEEEEILQKKPVGPQVAAGEAPSSVHQVLKSPGHPLDDSSRAYFEPRFGTISAVCGCTPALGLRSRHGKWAHWLTPWVTTWCSIQDDSCRARPRDDGC